METQLKDSHIPLRNPSQVMNLARMGCFHQTRLSFMRALLRSISNQQWAFQRSRWEVDNNGVGVAVYQIKAPDHVYSLICYANDLPPEKRSDRVIAREWDATFTLFDGIPSEKDIQRLRDNVPKQEAGHCTQSELILARANRSVRLFEHVVDKLSMGEQPNQDMIDSVGYLMRTTAVYGNGKFGISDRDRISDRPEFASAFHTELLGVWLIRAFTIDIVEHMAKVRGGSKAVKFDPVLKRRLGVGNSTGLGMAPFLILHPSLIHSWMLARETALARVRNLPRSTAQSRAAFSELISRMMLGVESWNTTDERQQNRIAGLKQDLLALMAYVKSPGLTMEYPWDALITWSEQALSLEGQELVVTLVIEPHGELVDDLAETMAIDEAQYFPIDAGRTVGETIAVIEDKYNWALEIDFSSHDQSAKFWYYSEEKLEPRVGERYHEPGVDQEHPLSYGRDVSMLYQDLKAYQGAAQKTSLASQGRLAEFLLGHPQHRHSIRRIQIADKLAYSEVQDNLISADMIPVDLLRCKLSFFGANKFDPKSDHWVRINMYQHAPFPDELGSSDMDDWIYPPLIA